MKKTSVAYRTEMPRGWTTVGGSFATSFVASAIIALLQIANNSGLTFVLAIVSALGACAGLYFYRRFRHQRVELSVITTEEMRPERKKGLIVLVGPGRPDRDPLQQAARPAFEFHHLDDRGNPVLKVCWIITTTGKDGGVPVALKLKDEFQGKGVKTLICTVDNAFNMRETFDLVENIYRVQAPQEGLTTHDVVADFTGATKPMSAGMVLACGAARAMQYVSGDQKTVASEPVAMRFSPDDR